MYTDPLLATLKNKRKIALITGAAQGIGAEIAKSFINKGYFVAFVDCNEQHGIEQEQILGGSAKFYLADLADQAQVEELSVRLHADYESIDAVIHNAKSPAKEKELYKNLETEWDPSFRVMLKHPILLNHLLLDLLKKSLNPSILYIGSTNAHFISQQPLSYHVVKGALSQAVRYLACEYAPHNIRVNLLHPGIVSVPGRTRRNPELFQQAIESVIPLKRAVLASEIGNCSVFFASEDARYITGASLDMDGGEHLKDHFHLLISQIAQQNESSVGTK